MTDYTWAVPSWWHERLGWDRLSESQKQLLGEFAFDIWQLGRHKKGAIEEVKYDGRLIVLDNGSRWEVDSLDSSTAEYWNFLDDVVVIDGKMYNLEGAESVDVTEEI